MCGDFLRDHLLGYRLNVTLVRGVFMKKNILLTLTSLLISLLLSAQAFSLALYDDFSGTSIDKDKWKETEFVRID